MLRVKLVVAAFAAAIVLGSWAQPAEARGRRVVYRSRGCYYPAPVYVYRTPVYRYYRPARVVYYSRPVYPVVRAYYGYPRRAFGFSFYYSRGYPRGFYSRVYWR